MFPGNIETSRYKLRRYDRLLASKMREEVITASSWFLTQT